MLYGLQRACSHRLVNRTYHFALFSLTYRQKQLAVIAATLTLSSGEDAASCFAAFLGSSLLMTVAIA
jgi:hypothetical protein